MYIYNYIYLGTTLFIFSWTIRINTDTDTETKVTNDLVTDTLFFVWVVYHLEPKATLSFTPLLGRAPHQAHHNFASNVFCLGLVSSSLNGCDVYFFALHATRTNQTYIPHE